MSRFRPRLSFANAISLIALFVALGGVSYAAIKLPANSVGTKQIKKSAVTTAKVKDGSLLAADFKAGQLPASAAGAQGPQGATGADGQRGAQGEQGLKGDQGIAGQDFTANSPMKSGETQVGTWITAAGSSATGFAATSFQFRPVLPANFQTDTGHSEYVTGGSETHCPGVGQADPGHFCVYEESVSQQTENALAIGNRGGATLFMNVGAASSYARGSWAVTAP